jgi:hypothetical protein
MDGEMQAALAGAIVGAIGGGLLTFCAQQWFERGVRKRNARHLAVRVVSILDTYVDTCVRVVLDDGLSYGQRDEQGCLVPQVATPPPPSFPEELDWTSIDHQLMNRILLMPNEAQTANDKIASISEYVAHPPDYDEYFEERQYQYSTLGLTAFELGRELRKTYGIQEQQFGDWNPVERLREAKQEVEKYRKKRQERFAAWPVPTVAEN